MALITKGSKVQKSFVAAKPKGAAKPLGTSRILTDEQLEFAARIRQMNKAVYRSWGCDEHGRPLEPRRAPERDLSWQELTLIERYGEQCNPKFNMMTEDGMEEWMVTINGTRHLYVIL